MFDCRQTSPVNSRFIRVRAIPVPLTNLAPTAVPPVELVASRPKARFELFGRPKPIWPPVVWSPSVAPNLEATVDEPYHPASAEIPSPPLPVPRTGNAKS